jgi:hypothetical protein
VSVRKQIQGAVTSIVGKENSGMKALKRLTKYAGAIGPSVMAGLVIAAPMAQAAPTPAFTVVGVARPTNLPPGTNEVQKIAVDATGGGFTLSFSGKTTALLPFDETSAHVQTALNALSTIGGVGGSVSVTGGPGDAGATHPYLVTFAGSMASANVAQITAASGALTGGAHTVTETTVTGGGTGSGTIVAYVQNIGGKAGTTPITGSVTLPSGIVTSATPEGLSSGGIMDVPYSCGPAGAGQSIVSCSTNLHLPPGGTGAIRVPVTITRGAGTASAEITFSGGGSLAPVTFTAPLTIATTKATPGVQAFSGGAYNDDGTPATQAGGHPYSASAAIVGTTVLNENGEVVPAGNPHNIDVSVPPGFIANPRSSLRCALDVSVSNCAEKETIIGTAAPILHAGANGESQPAVDSTTPKGAPAGFRFKVVEPEIQVLGSVRSDSDYGIDFGSDQTLEILPVYGSFFTFWGVPADPAHDIQRCKQYEVGNHTQCAVPRSSILQPTALVTNPTDCAGEAVNPPVTTLKLDTWEDIGNFSHASVPIPPVTGCNELEFEGNLSFQPQKTEAATPSAFDYNVDIPQEGLLDPEKLVTPELKNTKVVLPEGVALNPAAAAGLGGCSTAQMGLIGTGFGEPNPIHFNKAPVSCPENSKLGTFEIASPLLDEPLEGIVYLAAQDDNPFQTTIALYLVIEDAQTGLTFKLPGKAIPDPVTGQVTTTFPNNPQLPFERLTLHFKGGNLAPLATPETCGSFTTDSEVTPWSYPESGPPFHSLDSFSITSGPGGSTCANTLADRPFNPTLKAGTTSSAAAAYTGLEIKMARQDGEQDLRRLSFTLPAGVSAKLAGIPYCSDAAIAAAETRSGKAEQASSACPAASQIGSLTASAGIGSNPYFTTGKLYMTGPYKGAPISTVAIVPAVAGPYDLGNVVTRTPLYIDRATAKVTATSDPLPYILKGIPLHLRSIKVNVDRASYVLNPTSCDASSITAQMTGSGGDNVSVTDDVVKSSAEPFQVGGCQNLAFKPKLTAKVTGGTKRNDHPAFTAELTYPEGPGYANIKDVQVALPHSEFLDQSHINTVCTRAQATAHECPAGSIYGEAEATTPLLDGVLKGPVFLKSSVHKLPDLAIALKGPDSQPIEVEFAGRIDSIHGQIRNTIEGLPDVPVSKFVLRMKGGKKGLLVNSRDLCNGKQPKMTVNTIGQNNKRFDSRPALQNGCKASKKAKRHGKRRMAAGLLGGW